MKQKNVIYRIVAFLFAMSVGLNIWLFIENDNLKIGIDMYKDMINDYSGGNIDAVESAVIDNINMQKSKKNDE